MDIYNCSPIFIQNFLTTLEGKRRAKKRFGNEYLKAVNEFSSFDYSNKDTIEKIQNERFLSLLHFAYNHSPFYKEFYKNVDISKIRSVKDIGLLPILEKETVRQRLADIYTLSEEQCYTSQTSGTTGKPMRFRHVLSDYQKRLAYLDVFKRRHGFIHGEMKRASFNSSKIIPKNQKSKIFWRDNKAMNQRLYSTHRCKGDNIKYYVDDLNLYKPDSIDGYPSSIYDIAKYINANNIKVKFVPKAIFTTSETLYSHYREEIEKAFSCKVFDQYSSSEGATFITECSCGSLHIGEDTGIIEVDEDGEMLITSFFTFGTPLIRYKIGDKAIMCKDNFVCPCGSALRTVKSLEGRTKDFLLSNNGEKFTSVLLGSSLDALSNKVKSTQFVQNEIGTIHVYLEVDEGFENYEDDILKKELKYIMGNDVNFIIHHVSNIPKETSGKFKPIINNLNL